MANATVKYPYSIGLLLRRAFRSQLALNGIQYQEFKGILESEFIVDATLQQHLVIKRWIDDVNNS